MLRKAPSLESIEIFVAASHGESFRSVARCLALSPSAVSRRIASLETFLGMPLFDRNGQSQRLTPAGRQYLAMVEPAMDAIQRASANIAQGDQRGLKIATSHSFASAWLMPRLTELNKRLGIEVEIIPTHDFNALRSGEAHLGIWGGLSIPDDMIAETVVDANVVPVAAPGIAGHRDPIRIAEHLADYPLLSIRNPGGLWDRWFAASGQSYRLTPVVREYATLQLMYEAAASGAGIALAMPLVAEPWLRAGKLVPCAPNTVPLGEAYRLYRPIRRVARSETEQRFADWLHEAVKLSMTDFQALMARCATASDRMDRSPC